MNFEGPEKKFEMLVADTCFSLKTLDWKVIVQLAQATILSLYKSPACNAYLLSESSLFVYDTRVVMITCGRTTLLESIVRVLNLIPQADIKSLIYERKNENFPDHQLSTFDEDVRQLREMIPGEVVRFGQSGSISLFCSSVPYLPAEGDTTTEILMTGISPALYDCFSYEALSNKPFWSWGGLRLEEVFAGFMVDDYNFSPSGYSVNAVLNELYYTIHVTPQVEGSYVSFETNANSFDSISRCLPVLLDIFHPELVDVLVFSDMPPPIESLSGYLLSEVEERCLSCGYRTFFFNAHRVDALS